MLHLSSRWETDAFLKSREAYLDYTEADLEGDAQTIRELLLEQLAHHCSRPQRNSLLAIWESFKSDILEEVVRFEEFTNRHVGYLLDAKLMTDATTARRKLLDTRDLLGQLRKDFIRCAA